MQKLFPTICKLLRNCIEATLLQRLHVDKFLTGDLVVTRIHFKINQNSDMSLFKNKNEIEIISY